MYRNEGDAAAERPSILEDRPQNELPSTAIVMAVAAARGVEPDALPPLYDVVDPDAIDDLFRAPSGARPGVRVSFFYGESRVTVEHDAVTVELEEGTKSSRPV